VQHGLPIRRGVERSASDKGAALWGVPVQIWEYCTGTDLIVLRFFYVNGE